MTFRGITAVLLLLAVRPVSAETVRYFDIPEGGSTVVSRDLMLDSEDLADGGLRVPVDRRTRIVVTESDLPGAKREGLFNGSSGELKEEPFYFGTVEWVDDKGARQSLKNVYIPSSDTRETPLEGTGPVVHGSVPSSPAEDCPPNTPDGQGHQLTELATAVPGKETDLRTSMAYFKVGECLDMPGGKGANIFRASVGRKCDQMRSGTPPIVAQLDGKPIFTTHMCAIDAMARTIYGEMRGCAKHGARYPMATARIMLNRARVLQERGLYDAFANGGTEGLQHAQLTPRENLQYAPVPYIVPHLFEAPYQFNVWDRGDANNKAVLCPPVESPEWKQAVEIAIDAVTENAEFLEQTKSLAKVNHYSSSVTPRWKTKVELNGLKVGGQPIDKKECLRLWKVPLVTKAEEKTAAKAPKKAKTK